MNNQRTFFHRGVLTKEKQTYLVSKESLEDIAVQMLDHNMKNVEENGAQVFDKPRFRLTDNYSFAELTKDACAYWRVRNPEAMVCWDESHGRSFEPNAIVREILSKLPMEQRECLQLRAVPHYTQQEALLAHKDAKYESWLREQKTKNITKRDRQHFIEDVLYRRERKRWVRRMALRCTLHYVFTILLAVMLMLDPNRGYTTVRRTSPD